MNEKILVVDDEKEIADLLDVYLKNDGYTVYKFYNGTDALACLKKTLPDLAILDVMLPDIDGFHICQKIREKFCFPVIMLTAKAEERDELRGFQLGVDEYITKPFSPREVLARVKAVLRRMHELKDSGKASHLVVENLDIDMSAFTVKLDGKLMPCTPKEIEILWTLANNPGMVFSREHLLQSIWGYDFLGDTRFFFIDL